MKTGVNPPLPLFKMITSSPCPILQNLQSFRFFSNPLQKDIFNLNPSRIHPSPPLSLAILLYISRIMVDWCSCFFTITIIIYSWFILARKVAITKQQQYMEMKATPYALYPHTTTFALRSYYYITSYFMLLVRNNVRMPNWKKKCKDKMYWDWKNTCLKIWRTSKFFNHVFFIFWTQIMK